MLVCELGNGLKVYLEPDAVESVEEMFSVPTRSGPGEQPIAEIVTVSNLKHIVKDDGRTVGPRWVACKRALRNLEAGTKDPGILS